MSNKSFEYNTNTKTVVDYKLSDDEEEVDDSLMYDDKLRKEAEVKHAKVNFEHYTNFMKYTETVYRQFDELKNRKKIKKVILEHYIKQIEKATKKAESEFEDELFIEAGRKNILSNSMIVLPELLAPIDFTYLLRVSLYKYILEEAKKLREVAVDEPLSPVNKI